MRRGKLALSLAVAAALVVPALAGTWRLAPGKWVDLTASQKRRISAHMEETNNCRAFANDDEIERIACWVMQGQLTDGGVLYPPERITPKYIATNMLVAVAAFALTFAVVMLWQPVSRRYMAWLRR
jgi:hypothetical protein